MVFPTGLIADEHDEQGFVEDQTPLRLYYGAADTCVAAAETTVGFVLEACRE